MSSIPDETIKANFKESKNIINELLIETPELPSSMYQRVLDLEGQVVVQHSVINKLEDEILSLRSELEIRDLEFKKLLEVVQVIENKSKCL